MSGVEALARVLSVADGREPDAHDPMMLGLRAYSMWERYTEQAERILADPGPLLRALAEAGVLREAAGVLDIADDLNRTDADLIAHAPADLRWLLDALAEAEAERDALAATVQRVEALFAGGPDTPCRTLWRAVEGIAGEWHEVECVEVPMGDLRAALGGEDA